MHRFAAMRGDIPIPEIDVSKPALVPKGAAAQVPEAARSGGDNPARTTPVAAATEFVEGDGWIEWKGGECPVPPETIVHWKANGHSGHCSAAKLVWSHDDPEGFHPIIAYKVLP